MKRRVRREDRDEHLGRHGSLDGAPRLCVLAEPDVLLDRDDSPVPRPRESFRRIDDLLRHAAPLELLEGADHPALAQASQPRTQLRLEHHERGDRAVLERGLEERPDEYQVQQPRYAVHEGHQDEPQHDLHGARALDDQKQAIEQEGDE